MNHQKYIDRAVELAVNNVKNGGKPFGAVIVRDGKVIATGANEVVASGDLTTHAEIQAIREASQRLGEKALAGTTLYASGHPCPMCLSAIYLAGINEVYYASTLDEAEQVGLGVSHIYNDLKKDPADQSVPLRQLNSDHPNNPLQLWVENEE